MKNQNINDHSTINSQPSTSQMELTLNRSNLIRPSQRRQQTRLERAAWWFGKMRAVVDQASPLADRSSQLSAAQH